MSILLSAYFPEGIVFAADRNITYDVGTRSEVEIGAAAKVIPWPNRRAVVGYCGLAEMADLSMEEWMRQFAAKTRNFSDIDSLALQLRDELQEDFRAAFPADANLDGAVIVIHLGGFHEIDGSQIPAMYLISNTSIDGHGSYTEALRDFICIDQLQISSDVVPIDSYDQFQPWLNSVYQQGGLLWFNNGLKYSWFNILKGALWNALTVLHQHVRPGTPPTFEDRKAYCSMAVELFDSFYRYHYPPSERSVGGGVDIEWVPWPED